MKMNSPNDETPDELKGITEVLEKSLQPGSEEEIPPMPDDLRARLRGQYGEEKATSTESAKTEETLWNRIRSLFAQPAFSGSLAALVLVGVVLSLLARQGNQEKGEVMRGGGDDSVPASTVVILFDLEESQIEEVKGSGYFEEKLLLTTESATELEEWIARDGDSVVVDAAAGEIRHEDGRKVALPTENISDAVVELLGK